MGEPARDRLVSNIAGHASNNVDEAMLNRVFQYWRSVDQTIGERVEQAVGRGGSNGHGVRVVGREVSGVPAG